jgi:adenylate cyclase
MLIEKGEKTSLDGETKTLTVLFADIRNFTTLSEGFSAAELKAFLNHYLSDMTTVIFENKGTVDKYIGDLVMAFWGAPIDDPNHPINGIKAAFGMQEKLKSFSNPPLRIGIGLNTGSMNLGDMGSKYRQEYTVIGDSVNVASRLESITKFYHVPILVGPETYEKTKEEVEYLLIDRVRLMGKQHGIEIYQPLCMKGECSATLQKRSQLHAEALSAYFKRDWDVAEKLFSSLQPEEKELYALYLDRIRLFRTSPPPSDWDGTFTLSSK